MTVSDFSDLFLDKIVTPVKHGIFKQFLQETGYDPAETKFDGFTRGFPLGYVGLLERRDVSRNLPFTCGLKFDLWEKFMKEVQLHRFSGPYEAVPFDYFVQSPAGMVPKANGTLRLILHLCYRNRERLKCNGILIISKA